MIARPDTAAPAVTAAAERAFPERYFGWCAAALLLAMGAAQFVSATLDSQTVDESYHLTAGYAFLRERAINLNSEHPPLAQAISALPLLFFNLKMPLREGPGYSELRRERDFLYQNRAPAGAMLLAARSAHLLVTLALGALLAWWTRRHFGPAAALAALALFAFDPNILAHGHYVTTDVPAAFGFLAACLCWNAFLTSGRLSRALLCGAAAGLAAATKYSALSLFPIFLYLYGARWWTQAGSPAPQPFRCSFAHLAKYIALVAAVMLAVIYAAFGFETGPLRPAGMLPGPGGTGWMNLPSWLESLTLPAPSFFRGVGSLLWHNNVSGHDAYLLGRHSTLGWWYYFPVVMAVKTPTGTLLLLLLTAVAAGLTLFRRGLAEGIARLQRVRLEWYALILPPLFYLAMAMRANINIGIRHILPVYPFLFVLIGAALFGRGKPLPPLLRRAALFCLAAVALESAAAFPRYLAFFNAPSGGRATGWKYVVDSNLDWGQDLKRLKSYVSARGIPSVCVGSIGVAPPSYYGIPARRAPYSLEEARASGCVVAMSVTAMCYWRQFEPRWEWVARLTPIDRVADGFWIYDPR